MSVLDSVIGWVAPPCCVVCEAEGASLCQNCADNQIIPYGARCYSCGKISPSGRVCESCRNSSPRYVWVCTTYENAAKDLLIVYKFTHQRVASESLSALMAKTLCDFVPDEYIKTLNYLVVPVPTASSRIRQRGFDHSALLARQISRKLGLKSINALSRIGQSRQLGAPRSVRIAQPDGKYLVRYPNLVAGRNILLIDDVVTTGATLRAATKVLRAAGVARVDALVFAKRL